MRNSSVLDDRSADDFWESYSLADQIVDDQLHQEQLRAKFPTLLSAWEQYQVILRLCESEV